MDSSEEDRERNEPESRFRVDRICSIAVGCHRPSIVPLPILEVDETESPTSEFKQSQHDLTATDSNSEPIAIKSSLRKPSVFKVREEPGFAFGRKFSLGHYQPKPQSTRRVSINIMQTTPTRRSSQPGYANVGRRKTSVFLPEIDDLDDDYDRTLSNYTHDALPKMDNYRNLLSIQAAQRPTLDDLHDEEKQIQQQSGLQDGVGDSGSVGTKFGWIRGVLVRCLLNIWGVILFLRLSWMVGQAGIIQSMLIIAFSTVVTTITALSMSAVSTNGEMKGGGIYYMISRSLGPGWGGSTGAIFSFANAAMAALNIVGFSESFIALLSQYDIKIIDGGQNDNRIISTATVILLQALIMIGKEYEAKFQTGLLVILLVSMGDFVIGAGLGPQSDVAKAKGWVGLSAETFLGNMGPDYRVSDGQQQDFFTMFGLFFPAVAGIQAGASISGDLKDPASAIPKGTILAIFLTSASYALFGLIAGAGTIRDASGIVSELANGTFANCTARDCRWGLLNDYEVMNLMSIGSFGPIIYAGCFAATLSSALSCMVSGSEMFQALGKDEIYPGTGCLGKVYGKKRDAYWSFLISFVISLIFIVIADLNAIAPLISNFFMVTYALLNFCVFHADTLKPLGWRPTFKYYNKWISLLGVILCVGVMFLMSWPTALMSIAAVIIMYVVVIYRKLDINWGSTTQAQTYSDALNSLQALEVQEAHVKNYRPQILALTGYPHTRPVLVDFAYLLAKKNSLVICGNVSRKSKPARLRKAILENGKEWLESNKVKAFYVMTDNCTLDVGAHSLLQSAGVGKLTPNILLMGYKNNWQICDRGEVNEYFNIMHEALDNYVALAILRVKDGMDISHITGSLDAELTENGDARKKNGEEGYDNQLEFDPSDPNAMRMHVAAVTSLAEAKKVGNKLVFNKATKKGGKEITGVYRGPDGSELPKDLVNNLSLFTTKQKKGTIDVWWLYDDGGLTLLLPYIISTRKNWASCKLRVFALSNKKSEIEMEHRNMASLLSKFRIDYSDLTVIPDVTKRAENSTKAFFDSLIKDFKGNPDESDNSETIITENELTAMKEKTNRHLRLRELLLENSRNANMVVMTLPVPRRGTVSAPLYVSWLECLTRDMPPFLLVRGNQTSVLTFYS